MGFLLRATHWTAKKNPVVRAARDATRNITQLYMVEALRLPNAEPREIFRSMAKRAETSGLFKAEDMPEVHRAVAEAATPVEFVGSLVAIGMAGSIAKELAANYEFGVVLARETIDAVEEELNTAFSRRAVAKFAEKLERRLGRR